MEEAEFCRVSCIIHEMRIVCLLFSPLTKETIISHILEDNHITRKIITVSGKSQVNFMT